MKSNQRNQIRECWLNYSRQAFVNKLPIRKKKKAKKNIITLYNNLYKDSILEKLDRLYLPNKEGALVNVL